MTLAVRSPIRVVRHDDGADRWEMVHAQPHPRLRPYVIRYCGYDEQTTSFTRRIEAAGVEVPLIINLGPPLGVRLSTEADFTDHPEGFLAGLHDGYAVVDSHGAQRGLEVGLTPVGAQRLLGRSMREVTGHVVPLSDAFGLLGAELREQILEASDWPGRFAIVERFLIDRFVESPKPPAALEWALARMHATAGNLEIGALTTELGCSRRYLIGQFNDHVGVPPKLFARILRFQRACSLAASGTEGWSEIAQRTGYYDHAHLIRDFQQFAGRTPANLSASALPEAGFRADGQ
ncbi:MAG: helix-turn-helix domain-containing protein [Geodermatophilaceae bacterium]